MRIEVSFKDTCEGDATVPSSRIMPLERFVDFLREGKFGDAFEVRFEVEPEEAPDRPRRYFYTVKAEDVDTDTFMEFLSS